MRHLLCRFLGLAAVTGLVAGCGQTSPQLADGSWYGKVAAVSVERRTLTLAPACTLRSGEWFDVQVEHRDAATLRISPQADLQIYYRPDGSASAGHAQSAELKQLADVSRRGRLPDFPRGWFVTVRAGGAVSVRQDSGIRSSGTADRRTFRCVWSRDTQAFVN